MFRKKKHSVVWSAICKIIPRVKVNSICHMSIFIHVASENVCAMPKSIYNMGNCICHMPAFITVMCKFMCVMRYLIRCTCMFSFIGNVCWSIYEISILLCSVSETIYVWFNSFITWAQIALIRLCSRLYCVALAK